MDASPNPTTGTPADSERVAVDATLIDAMLALSPEERLRQNDRMLRTIQELRDGFAANRPDDAARTAGR
jgi:hypothetical protein